MKGSRMRELRKLAGLRQKEIAAELHIHFVTISNWERFDTEIPFLAEKEFFRLVNDVERCHWIKSSRRARRRAARFEKGKK